MASSKVTKEQCIKLLKQYDKLAEIHNKLVEKEGKSWKTNKAAYNRLITSYNNVARVGKKLKVAMERYNAQQIDAARKSKRSPKSKSKKGRR